MNSLTADNGGAQILAVDEAYCAPAEWIGNGVCDDGSDFWNGLPIYFNCPAFGNDGGDCDDPPTLGNLNNDGTVGVPDLLILLANWGPCPDLEDCLTDLTGSGSVGVGDLLILLANWPNMRHASWRSIMPALARVERTSDRLQLKLCRSTFDSHIIDDD